ncbi:MAG: HAD-IC family P-type ATPase [Roseibium sp.]|uniref:HAD-IC family P-type ATPase n=1 Tax=Roseibium sp. TaxID=1936156 RepID=UPI00260F13C6|nr:HAD-IC family P-type ATPase [Roseibium sp.]MCV0426474.1 HAD-IC family P-type ATPase [Roseibium sp.]
MSLAEFDAHAVSGEDCIRRFDTSAEQGVPEDEAERRRAKYGRNILPSAPRRSLVLRFIRHFHNVLMYVLIGGAVVTALLGLVIDTGVILAVVMINAIVGFIQEGRAENAMAAIRQMLAPRASVVRSGRRVSIDAADLVPGDIVVLEPGDRVAADLRLLDVHGLNAQEAILTGESVPVGKTTAPVAAEAVLGDRKSMAYSGTLITSGTGRGVVVATGTETEIGRISKMLGAVEVLKTPLVVQMDKFARWLTVLILLTSVGLLLFGFYVRHIAFDEMFMAAVSLAVAAVPEALPAVMTITLAVGVQAMAKRNAIVRRLPAIETIGAVSVICTDKTGTLTRNEMVVASAVTREKRFTITGEGYAPQGEIKIDGGGQPNSDLMEIARASLLCNDAALHVSDDVWRVEGDPMEGALLAFAAKAGVTQEGWTRRQEIPFDARRRYMAVLAENDTGTRLVLIKGAPERVLEMCAGQVEGEGSSLLDHAYWQTELDRIAALGQRVLAFAQLQVNQGQLLEADLEGSLILIGLVGLIDPPRAETAAAVAECHRAGIKVKMITGDHAGTAAAIGRQIGLVCPDKVLTGKDIEQLDDTALTAAALKTNIFARTSPEHKLRLVTALQANGLIVAMTGDGVNDAPALKRADIGVAMGITGSDATKEAAELVLADDNFASIASAVREGRTVWDNIRKVVSWVLPTSAGEAATIAAALLLGFALPVSPVQILWVNMITAVTLGLALAYEPAEAESMHQPPRPQNEGLLTGALVWHVLFVTGLFLAIVFGLFTYAIEKGYSLELAQTMAMNMLVVLEIFHLFYVRNIFSTSINFEAFKGTPAVWISLGVVTVAQFAVTYLPAAQPILGTSAVPMTDGIVIIGIGIVFFATIETEKRLRLILAGTRENRS